jgi:transposase
LLPEESGQRRHDLREVFNGLRYVIKGGVTWRLVPNDLPPWEIVYQQTQRWLKAGVFEAMIHDLRPPLRTFTDRRGRSTAVILDSRTLHSTPESGPRTSYDGAKRKKGSKIHIAVDTLAICSPPAAPPPISRTAPRWDAWPKPSSRPPARASGSPMWTRATPAGRRLKPPPTTASASKSSSCPRPSAASCCCPGRWVVKRSFAWATRFRRLVRDYDRLPETLKGLHFVAFACLMLNKAVAAMLSP